MLPLENINVLTFENGISAPLCTRLLGDFGADIVKVEQPGVGDVNRHWDNVVEGKSSAHVWVDRNKRSIELDLKSDEGGEIALELAEKADIVVQNFSPGVVDRLGIGYDDVREVNDTILYLSISGYGQFGPYRDRRAYDMIMQGETGLIEMTGSPESPAKIPLSICDINAAMYGTLSTITALYHRELTGEGQEIEVDMFSGILSWLGYFPQKYWYNGEQPERMGMRHHLLTPYGPFEAADGDYVNFAILSEDHWRRFCQSVIDRPEWLNEERFASNERRIEHREELESEIERIIQASPRDHWATLLNAQGIPWGDLNDLEDVLNHPLVESRDLFGSVQSKESNIRVIDNPIQFGAFETRLDPMPELGQDTKSVLSELGLEPEEIDRLYRDGVVGSD